MATVDVKKIESAKKVKLLRKCRVVEHGSNKAELFQAGAVVTVSGQTEFELITRDLATYDVNVKAASPVIDEKKK